jgi:hypothetical protein
MKRRHNLGDETMRNGIPSNLGMDFIEGPIRLGCGRSPEGFRWILETRDLVDGEGIVGQFWDAIR